MIRVRSPQDFWSGLLFILIGCGALWFGREFAVGALMRMGPGYVPRVLSLAMIGIGAFLALRSLVLEGPQIERSLFRPQIFVLLAIVVFGLLIERVGLAPTVVAVAIVASLASYEMKWIEMVTLAVCLSITSVILFITLLGQAMEIWRIPDFAGLFSFLKF